ncbi:MAG: uracil phosphoribosyltransferase [Proteobacteria bacterium]|nr:uracil phosphoribosyltransferase [Pseudomonadota bacterium]
MDNLHVMDHPTLQHKLGILRDKDTPSAEVRRIIQEIATLLAYEAARELPIESRQVTTPIGSSIAYSIKQTPLVVSILRAGNGMLDGVLAVLSEAKVGHIGIYRDRFTQNTIEYYFRLPDRNHVRGKDVLLMDPLVATGDTVIASIERLKQFESGNITVLCLLISQAALERIFYFYPQVHIFTIAVEETLNEQGFLIPGIGDVASQLYGWK